MVMTRYESEVELHHDYKLRDGCAVSVNLDADSP